MDETDPNLTFNEKGVCNYCQDWEKNSKNLGAIPNGKEIWEKQIVPAIKKSQPNPFNPNCIIGASGGIDSSYLCYIAKQYGLNGLVIHVDGGFDSPVGKRNLDRAIKQTGFPLKNLTFDTDTYRSIQLAYFKAGVVDTDVPADYLIDSSLRQQAIENNITYVLTGGNFFIDAYMPKTWTKTNKLDYGNLKGIVKSAYPDRYKQILLKFPKFTSWDELKYRRFYGLKYVTPLNYIGYNRDQAMKLLQEEWGFEDYGGKHYENIFTRFYQRYVLPQKFNVDKRKANYSNLIRSGGLTRQEALEKMKEPLYPPEELLKDLKVVLDFLQITQEEFNYIMNSQPRPHSDFGSDEWVYKLEALYAKPHHWVGNFLRRVGLK